MMQNSFVRHHNNSLSITDGKDRREGREIICQSFLR
jgi:hypothetical protein